MAVYSAGFVVLFVVFALLYQHAYRKRAELNLSEIEVLQLQAGRTAPLLSVSIGVLSIAIAAVAPARFAPWRGWCTS